MRNKNWIEFSDNNIKNKAIEDVVRASQSKKLKIHKETKGKRGKIVTVISGFRSQDNSQTGELLKKLKVYCGTGGSLTEKGIQLQGDLQDKVKSFLRKEGYDI